jgi:tRNA(Ile2) C34 agmatinyltransferase TiaS
MTPPCPVCKKSMKECGRTFQCEPCREIIIFFEVSDASPYVHPNRHPSVKIH